MIQRQPTSLAEDGCMHLYLSCVRAKTLYKAYRVNCQSCAVAIKSTVEVRDVL